MRNVSLALLMSGVLLCGMTACKTEKVYNSPNPSGSTTVIERDRPMVVEHDHAEKPEIQNNVEVQK